MLPPAELLLVADGRLPAGGHAHSGGLEAAVNAGSVGDLDSLATFLRGRLETSGLNAAGLAAAACALALAVHGQGTGAASSSSWPELDAAADARIPSPAQRAASRAQGRGLLRVARAAWPHAQLERLGREPHHPIVLGAVVAAAGGTAAAAAQLAALHAVSGPASAAVRLLALDPIAVTVLLAELAGTADLVAAQAAAAAAAGELPAAAAPLLDVYAETHRSAEVRLFAS